jgi:hypothetical protein
VNDKIKIYAKYQVHVSNITNIFSIIFWKRDKYFKNVLDKIKILWYTCVVNNISEDKTMAKQESKSDRFVRIAEARTNKIINMIQLLGNCSNKGTYDYTKEDVRKIFGAIEEELRLAKSKFELGENEASRKAFTLRK